MLCGLLCDFVFCVSWVVRAYTIMCPFCQSLSPAMTAFQTSEEKSGAELFEHPGARRLEGACGTPPITSRIRVFRPIKWSPFLLFEDRMSMLKRQEDLKVDFCFVFN